MTDKEREADRNTLSKLKIQLSSVPSCETKSAQLELIKAAKLLLQVPPNIDDALEAIGRTSGYLSNAMGI